MVAAKETALEALVRLIHAFFADVKQTDVINGDATPAVDLIESLTKDQLDRLTRIISDYQPSVLASAEKDVQPQLLFDYAPFMVHRAGKYTRNLVATGPDAAYNLILIVWAPDSTSCIHDHSGSHCIMKVLEGALVEELYRAEAPVAAPTPAPATIVDTAAPFKSTVFAAGTIAYINDDIGYHRISNLDKTRSAVSLHLYTPAFDSCRVFLPSVGLTDMTRSCTFDSILGTPAAAP